MPNALIVVGASPENRNITAAKEAADILQQKGYKVSFVNMMATNDELVLKYHMQQAAAELLLTFDMAGFELELMGGDLFYNSLCCPAMHILFDAAKSYEPALFKRMNFTMEFLTMSQEDADYLLENYPRVPKARAIDWPNFVD